jgi:hypothetical protein
MKGETPEQQWDRLQRKYQEAVVTSYPNPERIACPGLDILRELAARSARFEDLEEDSHWRHVVHCAPCYGVFLNLREVCRIGGEAKLDHEVR